MNKKCTVQFLLKRCFLLAVLLIFISQMSFARKKFFDYKIGKSLLEYSIKPGFDKIVFTYSLSVSGSSSYYSLEANVFDKQGAMMNPAPIKLTKNGVAKSLRNSTPDYKTISLTLDAATMLANEVDPNGDYFLSAVQTRCQGGLYVSYMFDTKVHGAMRLSSFTAFKINPSPPF
jgi:hypothetical protein